MAAIDHLEELLRRVDAVDITDQAQVRQLVASAARFGLVNRHLASAVDEDRGHLVIDLLRERARRLAALRELSQLTQDLGGYDRELAEEAP